MGQERERIKPSPGDREGMTYQAEGWGKGRKGMDWSVHLIGEAMAQ